MFLAMKRLIWADSLKGILIVLVVLGHAIQAQLGGGCFDNHVWNYIYSFHMAAFMAISGWLSYRANRPLAINGGGRLSTVYRRAQQLLIPFFMWSLLKLLSLKVFPSHEVFAFLYPDPYYWFLWALFWIQVFFIIGDWLSEKIKVKQEIAITSVWILLALLMLVLNVRILGFQYIAYYFAFYAIGYYLHKYEGLVTKNKVIIMFLFVVWAIMAWFWNMHKLPAFLSVLPLPGSLLQFAYRFVAAFFSVYVLINVSPMLLGSEKKWNAAFVWLGKVSLGIYGAHLLFLHPLTQIVSCFISDSSSVITIVFIISLVMSSFIVWALSKWKVTARLFLGKI